jgi:hypothetical protein
MKKISNIGSLTQLTSHYIGSLRVRVDAHKETACFVASKASVSLSKPDESAFDFPTAHRNISFGGQA